MDHRRTLLLAMMAAALLTGLAGSATAAGTLTAPAGTEYTGSFTMSLEGSLLDRAGFAEITCTSGTIQGAITSNNESEVSGEISHFELSNCGSATVDTLNNNGLITILKSTTAASAIGVEITKAVSGTSCVYGFGPTSTSLGTATNKVVETTPGVKEARVTLDVGARLPKISGGFLCANPAAWTANYLFTAPAGSLLD